jgi:hypothetical protein
MTAARATTVAAASLAVCAPAATAVGLDDVAAPADDHREVVPSLRHQTHGDWRRRSMPTYRRELARMKPCAPIDSRR